MLVSRLLLPLTLLAPLLSACDPPPPPPSYSYYTTCGDPVCREHRDLGIAACTTEKEGDRCAALGQQCDPGNMCNSLIVCAAKDPKQQPGGCPISSRRFKQDIAYVDDAERARYADEIRRLKLATYQYRDADKEAARRRLGFLIEDQPQSASVDPERDMVDLYGYTSMAVAALQVQAQRIERLEAELAQLRAELKRRPRR